MKAIIQVELSLPSNITTKEEAVDFMDEVEYDFTYVATESGRERVEYLEYETMNCEIRHQIE